MKYGIWRHENALGNSAEHTVGLAKHIKRSKDKSPKIYVETPFQKAFALCIPNIKKSDIVFFEKRESPPGSPESIDPTLLGDIHMPNVYPQFDKHYNGSWADLCLDPDVTLTFPEDLHENKHDLPKGAIIMSIREAGTYHKRVDEPAGDEARFVNPQTFFDLALHYAEQGHQIVRIGDKNQTPMPKHSNILDFALMEDRNMLDDLFLINYSKVYLSCDSGLWPIAGGMKKNLVLSNLMSPVHKRSIINWLPKETTISIFKEAGSDNSFKILKQSVDIFL